jgi:hypothetical protein
LPGRWTECVSIKEECFEKKWMFDDSGMYILCVCVKD